MHTKLNFSSDYTRTAHPAILARLVETAGMAMPGYGTDPICQAAKEKIRTACQCPDAEVFFLSGGTQMNAAVIDSVLRSYQGVIAAETGHISTHEAGAIEYGGHKVLTIPGSPEARGKIRLAELERTVETFENDMNRDHMVMPAMVYISQPTEYGTLYSLDELTDISKFCREHDLTLYVDGARLAYALASPANDVTLSDLARLTDAFYIGGTKCGAFIGEALVIAKKNLIPHFFTIMKQHGALLAKGWLLGLQFDVLFTDGLYEKVGQTAIAYAEEIQRALREAGFPLYFESPTNQLFVVLNEHQRNYLEKEIDLSFWEEIDETHTVMRIATSWSTTREEVDRLLEILSLKCPKK